MQLEIDKIYLVMENCEIAIVDSESIELLRVKNPSESIIAHGSTEYSFVIPEYFMLALNKTADTKDFTSTLGVKMTDEHTIFERLMLANDLTHVIIRYEDGSERKFEMPWSEDEYINEYQSTYVRDGKLLLIVDGTYERSDYSLFHSTVKEFKGD